METNDSLRDLDRAAARPFIDYPRTPWWYPILIGGYFAAILAAVFMLSNGNVVVGIVIEFVAILALGAFIGWYRRRWGTWPKMSEAPAEIRGAYRRYLAGVAVSLVLIVVVGLLSPHVVTVVVTFLVFTTLIWGYERKVYPAACADVRARLM